MDKQGLRFFFNSNFIFLSVFNFYRMLIRLILADLRRTKANSKSPPAKVYEKNSVRTLEMNRVVSLIFNADKTSGGKKKKSTPILACFSLEWSRRGSNPRPNNESIYFLHVYFVIVFR